MNEGAMSTVFLQLSFCIILGILRDTQSLHSLVHWSLFLGNPLPSELLFLVISEDHVFNSIIILIHDCAKIKIIWKHEAQRSEGLAFISEILRCLQTCWVLGEPRHLLLYVNTLGKSKSKPCSCMFSFYTSGRLSLNEHDYGYVNYSNIVVSLGSWFYYPNPVI